MTYRLAALVATLALALAACATPASPPAPSAQPPAAPPAAAANPPAAGSSAATTPAPTAATAAASLRKVQVAVVGAQSEAAIFIGMEKGYYAEAGMEVELTRAAGAGDVVALLAAGQLDVLAGGLNVGILNAIASGLPIAVVADHSHLVPGNDSNIIMVRSDLAGQINKAADLRGRTVAINTTSSPLAYALGKALEAEGLTFDDVQVVTLPFPEMIVGFRNQAIDAATEIEPFVSVARDQRLAEIWKPVSEIVGPMEIGVLTLNVDWAQRDRQLANEFMVAFLRGARESYDAIHNGPRRPEVIRILTQYTDVKDPALYDKLIWADVNPDGYVDVASIEDQMAWYLRRGDLKQPVPIDRVVDNSYVDYALSKLGRFQR
ncbi:MAG TPA: ABC transporter substrate-binding protein [Chloroflexota bacterium]|jgi:NitT/TauT family transport system substrate-binding protein